MVALVEKLVTTLAKETEIAKRLELRVESFANVRSVERLAL